MGEGPPGRRAPSPPFFKSTSVRTRIEWQNWQVVWTALDQRNFTGAPQLGQFAVGPLIFDRAAPPGERKLARVQTQPSATPQNRPLGGAGNKRRLGTAIRIPGTYGKR